MIESKYIHAGYLIDGSGGPVQKDVLLTVVGGKIAGIEPFDRGNFPDPTSLVDLSRCTIVPPLVDSHVHLALSGTIDKEARAHQLEAGYYEIEGVVARNIGYHFSHGVFALRDGGDKNGYVLRYRDATAGASPLPVQLKVSGRAWYRQGRYGGMLGRHPAGDESLALAFGREKEPIDQVKLINSGPNSLSEFGRETPPQFKLEEMRETVRLAHRRGLPVMVHANGVEPVKMAIEAGADSIEHGYFMGRENLERMAEKQIFWVPTLFAMQALTHSVIRISPAGERAIAARNVASQLQQVAWARELGVVIAAGTDSGSHGVLHGEAMVEEIKLLIKGGYSLPEALKSATLNGARLLGLDELGLLAKGRPADFLVALGTPAQLPRKLAYLEAIYINGNPSPLYRK
jgi:imidazolonepropionase-like amidohydrolase